MDARTGRPPARVYSLTTAGRRTAKGARAEWLAIADMLHTLLGET